MVVSTRIASRSPAMSVLLSGDHIGRIPAGGLAGAARRSSLSDQGLDRSALAQPASAFLMKDATATGWAMNAVCEPVIDSVAAPIRSAMTRSASGGIALSCSDTRYQDGLVFHPAAVASSVSAAIDNGRCVAHMTAARSAGTSAQNVSRN